MIELEIVGGRDKGREILIRQLPVVVGRQEGLRVLLSDPGIWDQHMELRRGGDGYYVAAIGEAVLAVNGKPVREVRLRNGDLLEAGGAKVRFWLASASQKNFRAREMLSWAALLLITLAEGGLIFWLWQ